MQVNIHLLPVHLSMFFRPYLIFPLLRDPSLVVDHLSNTTWDKKNFDLQGQTRQSLLVKVWFDSIQCFKIRPVPNFSEESKKNIKAIKSMQSEF